MSKHHMMTRCRLLLVAFAMLTALALAPLLAAGASAAPDPTGALREHMRSRVEREQAIGQNPFAAHRDLARERGERARAERLERLGLPEIARRAAALSPSRNGVLGGGAPSALYVAFDDYRAVGDGYLAKYNSAGAVAPGWPAFALPIIQGAQIANDHRAIDDGSGGRIVAWQEASFDGVRIRAQRINGSASRLWGAEGVVVTSFSEASDWDVIQDGAGGAFFASIEVHPGSSEILIQHLNASGVTASGWPAAGVVLGASNGEVDRPRLAWDGSGGVYATWLDYLNGGTFAQHLDATGSPTFPVAEGTRLGWVQTEFEMSPDGTDGLTLTWFHYSAAMTDFDVYAERLNVSGTPTWGDSGIVVCGGPAAQILPSVIPDGSDGVVIGWFDDRDPEHFDTYAIRLDASGAPFSGWPIDGTRVAEGSTFELVPDGLGGAFGLFLTFNAFEAGQLSVQHVLSNGAIANNFDPDGLVVSTRAISTGFSASLDGSGGLLLAWQEWLGSPGIAQGVFGQRIDDNGSPAWGGGTRVELTSSHVGRQIAPSFIQGGGGGARVGFLQYNATGWDAGYRRVNMNGIPQGATTPVAFGGDDARDITIISDGGNGAIALWTDLDGSPARLLAQRFDLSGVSLWAAGGVMVNDVSADVERFGIPTIPAIGNSMGGVITAWNWGNVTLQRLDSNGVPHWGASGSLAFIEGNSFITSPQNLQPAESGGAFVFAERQTVNGPRWSVQKVDSLGARQWGDGGVDVAKDTLGFQATAGFLALDGFGGVFAAYQFGIEPGEPAYSMRVVRLQSNGAPAPGWPAEGIEFRGGFEGGIITGLVADGAGGAIATWMEFRGGRIGSYAQNITSVGSLLWNGPEPGAGPHGSPVNQGVSLALDSGEQVYPVAAPDGAGGAVFAWLDGRGSSWDVYAQRISSAGARAWGSAGLGVCTANGPQGALSIDSDGSNGALVAWSDGRDLPVDLIEIQRVSAAGALMWTSGGVVSTLASLHTAQVVDGVVKLEWLAASETFTARLERRTATGPWQTLRDVAAEAGGWVRASDADVTPGAGYAYRLVTRVNGADEALDDVWVDVPVALAFALHGARPNPVVSDLTVSFALPNGAPAQLEVLDAAGRRVFTREVGSLGAGSHVLNLGTMRGARAGFYLMRLTQAGESRVSRLTLVQ